MNAPTSFLRSMSAAVALAAAVALPAHGVISELDNVGGRSGYTGIAGTTLAGTETKDFVFVGTSTGTAVVDITTPTAASEVAFIPGASNARRALATYVGVLYVAGSETGGLQIVDITNPASPVLLNTFAGIARASGLSVDPLAKRLYASGTEIGVAALDVTNPAAPIFIQYYGGQTLEDAFYDTGLVYGGATHGVAVLDVSGLPAPISLKAWVTYRGVASSHVWLSENRRHLYATDRKPGGAFAAISLTPLTNAVRIGSFELPPDPGSQPESVVIEGDAAFVPWGSAGLVVLDVSDPKSPQETDRFVPAGGTGPVAVVDAYPFASNGVVCALDTERGLFVLDFVPSVGVVRGFLTSADDDSPAQSTLVSVPDVGKSTLTENDGSYRLRLPTGTHRVFFSRPDRFAPDSVDVAVTAPDTLTLDRGLAVRPFGTLRGSIIRLPPLGERRGAEAGHPEGTIISFLDAPYPPAVVFDASYFRPFLPAGTYHIEANEFGYNPEQALVTVLDGVTTIQDFTLSPVHIVDKFETETGWTVGAPGDNATTGIWQREDPNGTGAGFVQPANDESPGLGVLAFVTGNAPGSWIDGDDVDGGKTTLTSPIYDLSSTAEPIVRYYRWFCNNASWGNEGPDGDAFRLDVSNDGGTTWTNIATDTSTQLFWKEKTYVVSRYATPTSQVRFRFVAEDIGTPSIVEAGVDDFVVYSGGDLMQLPGTPVALESVSIVSVAAGTVQLTWTAEGRYASFSIERALDGDASRLIVGEVDGTRGPTYVFADHTAPSGERVVYWIVGHGIDGEVERVGPFAVDVRTAVAGVALLRSAPNPVSRDARVSFRLPRATPVALAIYAVDGRLVRTLVEGLLPAGDHEARWDGTDLAGRPTGSGVYLYRLAAEGVVLERKLVLVR